MNKKFLDKVKKEVQALRDLKKNWDGYQGDPIDPSVIKGMLYFVDKVLSIARNIHKTYIVPGGYGSQFEWHCYDIDKVLEIEFEDENTVHYLKWDSDNNIKEEDIFNIKDENGIDRCIDLLSWFNE